MEGAWCPAHSRTLPFLALANRLPVARPYISRARGPSFPYHPAASGGAGAPVGKALRELPDHLVQQGGRWCTSRKKRDEPLTTSGAPGGQPARATVTSGRKGDGMFTDCP